MTQALTNVLLMDAVVACLDTQKPIIAASKLAHLDKIRQEGLGVTLVLRLFFKNENTLHILTRGHGDVVVHTVASWQGGPRFDFELGLNLGSSNPPPPGNQSRDFEI